MTDNDRITSLPTLIISKSVNILYCYLQIRSSMNKSQFTDLLHFLNLSVMIRIDPDPAEN